MLVTKIWHNLPRLRIMKPMIEISEYDPHWAGQFQAIKEVICRALGGLIVGVEHIGSTAVPGLAAKPIIDIEIVINSRDLLPRVIESLERLGYRHQGDKGIAGREAFARADDAVPADGARRTWPAHHLYVCDKDNRELARQIAFRDFLREHPEYVVRYAELKRALARLHADDRPAYTEGKTAFVSEVLARTSAGL